MYSNAGPVIVPVGLAVVGATCATGSVIVVLKFALLVPAEASQPLHTMVKPRGMRKALASTAGSVIEPGSLPPGTRPKVFQVLRPRLGGSYIILCAPFLR